VTAGFRDISQDRLRRNITLQPLTHVGDEAHGCLLLLAKDWTGQILKCQPTMHDAGLNNDVIDTNCSQDTSQSWCASGDFTLPGGLLLYVNITGFHASRLKTYCSNVYWLLHTLLS
jgi:hypothetical protein